ncbi:MAG TPA: glycosyltransferase, partial [Verrucomicrobiae bacterium]|nr:glycosyltransferase [Verrucomicrobiae bacterium]
MKLIIFGLTVSSSWGNGHATLWRGLCRALAHRGHEVVFFERDVPYYAAHRDLRQLPGGKLVLYPDWGQVLPLAQQQLDEADVGMVTSYCPDGIAATQAVIESRTKLRVFYDLDTPVTLSHLRNGKPVQYIGPRGLRDFDLVLSYTGGNALRELRSQLGARRVAPLYGSVDPDVHRPVEPAEKYRADLSHLGTYAEDRQRALSQLLLEPARSAPHLKFLIGGALYPEGFPWTKNIYFARHVAPGEHPAFYCSSRFTLNVTRGAMAEMGYCPSGRLFEAAACGTPIISDSWEGLEQFFSPGSEILTAQGAGDVLRVLEMSEADLSKISAAARERV